MKRRIFILLICLLLMLPAYALADGQYVFDEAGLLSADDVLALEQYAAQTTLDYGCGIYIVAVDDYLDISSDGVYEAATKLYSERGFGYGDGKDGILLLLSMADRDFSLIVYGSFASAVFDDYTRELVCEEFLDDFRDNDWYSGFSDFISICITEIHRYQSGRYDGDYVDDSQYYGDYEDDYVPSSYPKQLGRVIGTSAFASAIVALIVCLILKRKLRSVKPGRDADAYAVNGSFKLSDRRDIYTHTTVTRVRHEKNNNNHIGGGMSSFGGSHSSGGGFSGTSGKF